MQKASVLQHGVRAQSRVGESNFQMEHGTEEEDDLPCFNYNNKNNIYLFQKLNRKLVFCLPLLASTLSVCCSSCFNFYYKGKSPFLK